MVTSLNVALGSASFRYQFLVLFYDDDVLSFLLRSFIIDFINPFLHPKGPERTLAALKPFYNHLP
jgi:hypothetical protein